MASPDSCREVENSFVLVLEVETILKREGGRSGEIDMGWEVESWMMMLISDLYH